MYSFSRCNYGRWYHIYLFLSTSVFEIIMSIIPIYSYKYKQLKKIKKFKIYLTLYSTILNSPFLFLWKKKLFYM